MLRKSVPASVLLIWSLALGQSPSRPAWNTLCQESAMIVTGVVESSSWVIRPEKRVTATTSLPDGKVIVKLPNPAEYVVGTIFRVEVGRVMKKHGKIKVGSQISVLVPGFMTTEQPALVEKQNYLLFLSKLEADSETFAGTMIYKPRTQTDSVARFKPELTYAIVGGPNGAIRISSDNMTVVDEVKAAMQKND